MDLATRLGCPGGLLRLLRTRVAGSKSMPVVWTMPPMIVRRPMPSRDTRLILSNGPCGKALLLLVAGAQRASTHFQSTSKIELAPQPGQTWRFSWRKYSRVYSAWIAGSESLSWSGREVPSFVWEDFGSGSDSLCWRKDMLHTPQFYWRYFAVSIHKYISMSNWFSDGVCAQVLTPAVAHADASMLIRHTRRIAPCQDYRCSPRQRLYWDDL